MKLLQTAAVAAGLAAAFAAPAFATPSYTSFGELPSATFGGSGIPNDAVAIYQSEGITLGIAAHERYCNVPVTNDGAGTFHAEPGYNDGLCGSPHSMAGTFNVDFYADLGEASEDEVDVYFGYDTDPGEAVDPHFILLDPFYDSVMQDSWSPTFAFLAPFDPLADGFYSYFIGVGPQGGPALGGAVIDVVVGNPAQVPEPAALGLLGLGIAGIAAARRRKA